MPKSPPRPGSKADLPGSHLDELPCFNFYMGWRVIQQFYADAFPRGMNPQRLYAIGVCGKKGATISTIARSLCIGEQAVSNLIARMEKEHLVRRVRDETDRRSVVARATAKGMKLAGEADKNVRAFDKRLFEYVSHRDAAALRRVVKGVVVANDSAA